MGTLRTRTVGGTVVLALLLVLAGCSGGGADGTPAATDVTGTETTATENETVAATDTATTDDGNGSDDGDGNGAGVERYYEFDDGEAYGYEALLPNGTVPMTWIVTGTSDTDPELVAVNVSFGQYSTTGTTTQRQIFAELISDGSVGESFRDVRSPVVLAAGQDLRVGNSWTIDGDATVGDGFEIDWEQATANITRTESVAGETCYRMEIRISGNETGPASCLKEGWPFALAVDGPEQDYRLAEFDRP